MSSEKKLAAEAAVKHIENGMVVGLGTGSTAAYAIRCLGERVRDGLEISGVPTSLETKKHANSEGIPLIDFTTAKSIDICIDGADEIDGDLNMIKGGGGALLHEKIVASASSRYIIIVDSSKRVKKLGAFPVPVEVIPFGWPVVFEKLKQMNACPVLRKRDGKTVVTDEGNVILDCHCGEIPDARTLETELNLIPGVVENGLFVRMCGMMIMARGEKIITEESK